MSGDVDVAAVAAVLAVPARARVVQALADGRALSAGRLACEAGLSPSATSAHLDRLRRAGFIEVARSGRHRYHRLADERVAEALSALAPAVPVRSLKQGARAAALRRARSCYDRVAGRLGVAVTGGLLGVGVLERVDGVGDTSPRWQDPVSSRLSEHPYRLGPGVGVLGELGVDLDRVSALRGRRPLLRFCLDWSEQRHHVAGALGAALLESFVAREWVRRRAGQRALVLTEVGREALSCTLGLAGRDLLE
ncbi:metalloregulator ArsR/SmtB family transcription factor [Saccharopolyspora halophila]|uniref:Metalloregulator ArsR/SmtB family transcription factor n=1 Tax=Saccharopolyspora halophila TaxID=405551 RepID=A0ABN3GI12_9PSEU